ncbi:putative glucose-methanol-choline oxidoreductase protein [Eutypa lata UCREL1]|uniref:Putative glucose-methanol-choline oxidoreductase protein n=1 Tax=Eutypa lata (strain UCR-EL1) TaxID=1287681 RepID=M7SL09_EUTLA|nr:putative glucose-methanol-choline oxidoreductase protein [Eutypa lata UCREL1]
MLGGSSGLNGLTFTASAKAVVDGWADLGNPGWEWPAFSQSLAQTYTLAKAPPLVAKPSSNQGPLQVSYADDCTGRCPKVWADTIESLGFPGSQDTLTGQAAGGLMIPDTVDPAMVPGRAHLTVRTGVEVKKVLLEKAGGHGGTNGDAVATGVEYTDLTTGTTTTLLELLGIGDVRWFGVDHVVVDTPGVGENLQNHPITTVSFEVADAAPPTKDVFLRAALRQDEHVLGGPMKEYMEHHTGIFASSGVTSAAQLPLPGLDAPEGTKELEGLLSETGSGPSRAFDVTHERFVRTMVSSWSEASGYYIFGPVYAAFNPDGTGALPPMDGSEDSYITVALMLAHPLSRGSVHVTGAGPDQT